MFAQLQSLLRPPISFLIQLHASPAKRGKVRPADKLQVKGAAPLLDSPDPSKTQSTVVTVLGCYNAPRRPGPACI
jgi:hypothetical protein